MFPQFDDLILILVLYCSFQTFNKLRQEINLEFLTFEFSALVLSAVRPDTYRYIYIEQNAG